MNPHPPKTRLLHRLLIAAIGTVGILSTHTYAQNANENPAYIADSPRAHDAIVRIPQLVAQGNLSEASRLADDLITTLGSQLVQSSSNPKLFIPVRDRVHELLENSPLLAEHYREKTTPLAERLLIEDKWMLVWSTAWFTEPGFTASLHKAQTELENARFHDARRTLNELRAHPDAKSHAPQAAVLAQQLARYIPGDSSGTLVSAWMDLAGIEPSNQTLIEHPPRVFPRLHTSIPWQSDAETHTPRLHDILPSVLQEAVLTPITELDSGSPRIVRRSGAAAQPAPWTMPAAMGGFVYTNDGFTISCFDRFTLRLVWRYTPVQTDDGPSSSSTTRARLGRILEDSSTVSIDRGVLFAAIGLARSGNQSNEGQLLALDATTGKTKWSVELAELDPLLEGTAVRGSLILDGDTIIFAARKSSRQQRIVGMNIVGLNRYSGALKWIRPIGSAGSLPFQQSGQVAHSGIVHNGVVYMSDAIGLMTAIEADSGRVRWVRRLPPPELYSRKVHPIWAATTPIIINNQLFVLSPSRDELYELDPETGHQIAMRTPQPAGRVFYIIAVGDTIASVGETQVVFYQTKNFETAILTRSLVLGEGQGGIRGRIVSLGDRAAVPIESRVAIIDPADPITAQYIDLESSGNILPLDGQIVVVDDSKIQNYLSWETASQILSRQVRETNDLQAAITLAELAHIAVKNDQILPTIDTALRLLREHPKENQAESRTRLFDVLHAMVVPQRASNHQSLDRTVIDALLQRMGALASNNEQIVAHHMALGSHHELHTKYSEAIHAYQSILTRRTLQSTMWEGDGFRVRAELEASKRIRAILTKTDASVYEIYDELAQGDLDNLALSNDPLTYEQLATRYPWSIAAAEAWAQASKIWSTTGYPHAAIRAAEQGLLVAQTREIATTNSGTDHGKVITEQLAWHAVSGLLAMNRSAEARIFIVAFESQFPDLHARLDGSVITRETITAQTGVSAPRPRLGTRITRTQGPTLVTGSPVRIGHRTDPRSLVLFVPQYNETRLISREGSDLRVRWSRTVQSPDPPLIPWLDTDSTLAIWSPINDDHPGIIESIETSTGRSQWIITNLRESLQGSVNRVPDFFAKEDQQIPVPIDGIVPLDQLIVVTDGLTVVVTDRIGRSMGIDMNSGRVLWHALLPVNRVHDIDLSGGILGVCGSMVADNEGGSKETPIVAAIDARTGNPIRIMDELGNATPNWIRITPENHIIAATQTHIFSIDLDRVELNWIYANDDLSGTGTAAWIFGQQLLFLSDIYNNLLTLDRSTGVLTNEKLAFVPDRGWIDVRAHDDRILVSSPIGLSIFGPAGEQIGQDPVNTTRQFAGVAFAENLAAFLRRPDIDSAGRASSTVVILDTHHGRILDLIELAVPEDIDRQPTSIEILDGFILIGYGEVSIVLAVPEEES